MKKINFFIVAPSPVYILSVIPNFKEGTIEEYPMVKMIKSLIPFGFPKRMVSSGGYHSAIKSGKTKKEVYLETFKEFIEGIKSVAGKTGISNVLIQIEFNIGIV